MTDMERLFTTLCFLLSTHVLTTQTRPSIDKCNDDGYFCLGIKPKDGCDFCSAEETLYFFGPNDRDQSTNCFLTQSCPITFIGQRWSNNEYFWFVTLLEEGHSAGNVRFWVSKDFHPTKSTMQAMAAFKGLGIGYTEFTYKDNRTITISTGSPDSYFYRLREAFSSSDTFFFSSSNLIAYNMQESLTSKTNFEEQLYINIQAWKYDYINQRNLSMEVHTPSPIFLFKRKDAQNYPTRGTTEATTQSTATDTTTEVTVTTGSVVTVTVGRETSEGERINPEATTPKTSDTTVNNEESRSTKWTLIIVGVVCAMILILSVLVVIALVMTMSHDNDSDEQKEEAKIDESVTQIIAHF